MKSFCVVAIFYFSLIFSCAENIFYLPEDTYFPTKIQTQQMMKKVRKNLNLDLFYHWFPNGYSWGGGVGHYKLVVKLSEDQQKLLSDVLQFLEENQYIYIFFYNIDFDIEKHEFLHNYNPNKLFYMNEYGSMNIYDGIIPYKKSTKKKQRTKDAPKPIMIKTRGLKSVKNESIIKARNPSFDSDATAKSEIDLEAFRRQIVRSIMVKSPVYLNEKYCFYIITKKQFELYKQKDKYILYEVRDQVSKYEFNPATNKFQKKR